MSAPATVPMVRSKRDVREYREHLPSLGRRRRGRVQYGQATEHL
jgi:hypothetical protein